MGDDVKYARKSGPHWIDVYTVPGDFPSLDDLNKSLPGGDFVEVDGGLLHGALHNDGDGSEGTYTNPASIIAEPEKAWDAYDFKARFTTAERVEIRTKAKTDPVVEDFLDMLDTAGSTNTRILPSNELLQQAFAYMVGQEILTSLRADEILGIE